MEVIAIQGYAGTSKTTTLAQLITKTSFSFVGLAYTHHAVKNLYNKCLEFDKEIDIDNFRTIHSFFRIDCKTNAFIGSTRKVEYVFIDEFSMIDKELMTNIINDCKYKGVIQIYIAGDFLQLPRIGTTKGSISIDTLKLFEGISFTKNMIKSLQHFDSSCLNLATKIIIKEKQYRNTKNKYLDWILEGSLSNHFNEMEYVPFDKAISLIKEGYTLIASKYSILDRFKDELYPMFKVGDIVYGMETEDEIINGNQYEILSVDSNIILARNLDDDKRVFFRKPFKVYPIRLFTFHKSQGLTFKNVIVCTDDLFEFQMLYTGITRSAGDIKFFSSKPSSIRNEYLLTHSGEKEIETLKMLFQRLIQ